MRLYHYPVRCIGLNHCHCSTIGVGKVAVDIGLDVIQPDLLSGSLMPCGRGIVEVVS